MGVLEKITQMKKQGVSDEEIVTKLKEQGISPREINDALSQSQIKNAVSNNNMEEMEPSIMENVEEAPVPSQTSERARAYPPKARREMPEEEMYMPATAESQQEYYPQEPQAEYYQPEAEAYGYAPEGVSTDTIIEISEQVFSEKVKKIQKKLEELDEFKTLSQTKIENTLERIKRIETMIDKLQITILEKIGSYGKTLDEIKKEMSMMQDSFGKIINPLTDQVEKSYKKKSVPFETEEAEESEEIEPFENITKTRAKRTSSKK